MLGDIVAIALWASLAVLCGFVAGSYWMYHRLTYGPAKFLDLTGTCPGCGRRVTLKDVEIKDLVEKIDEGSPGQ